MKTLLLPSQSRLRNFFDYNAKTGKLTWKNKSARYNGKRAGNIAVCGYRQVSLDGVAYYEHRVIWVWVNGAIEGDIDHINHDRADNRLENLRLATRSQNLARKPTQNKGGWPTGIYVAKNGTSYSARIRGKYLGSFPTIEQAVAVRRSIAVERYGDFVD